jgi:hypothetical protein
MSLPNENTKQIDTQNEGNQPQREIIKPTEVVLEWEAPERVFVKQPREFFKRIAVIISFFVLLLVFIKEFLVIAVLGVVFFVTYVFYTVPPKNVKHQVSNNGVNYGGEHLYRWKDLISFYFEMRSGVDTLVLNTVDPLPGRLFLLLNNKVDKSKLQHELNQRISIVENPEKSIYEDWMKTITSKMKTS